MPGQYGAPGTPQRVRIGASDVSLAGQNPGPSTILNVLPARVAAAEPQDAAQMNVVVRLGKAGEGARLLARVTRKSWEALGARPGDLVHVQVKSVALVAASRSAQGGGASSSPRPQHRGPGLSSTGGEVMKISARNVLKGKVVGVEKGQTTAHVRIDIGGGKIVTASITNQAVDELGLKTGQEASAVIKASDVMVAID